jgi:hypothetical protein
VNATETTNISSIGETSRPARRWLLIYNCQATGLANSLTLLGRNISIEHWDVLARAERQADFGDRLDDFDQIIVAPRVEQEASLGLSERSNVWRVPHLLFSGYHPDLCYLLSGGRPLPSPLTHYHSVIAYAAFASGLSETGAMACFTEANFADLGYFDQWEIARDELVSSYQAFDLDIRHAFVRWSRRGPFMHTVNHPGISALRDIAELILRRAEEEVTDTDIVPHDNLVNGPIFPVYPEIGMKVGVRGSYTFKRGGGYSCISLEQFVRESFEIYRATASIEVHPSYEAKVARAVAMIGGRR